jgi:uncharacterized protein (DUF2126 family)
MPIVALPASMPTDDEFDAAVRRHDAEVAATGLAIWVGSEPTFTDRLAQSPPWLNAALGGDKEQRAQALLAGLCARFTNGLVLRSEGRRYPGEDAPRWNLGIYRRRDGAAFWRGPPDPILCEPGQGTAVDLSALAAALKRALFARGFADGSVIVEDGSEHRPLAPDPSAQTSAPVFMLSTQEIDGQQVAHIELPPLEDVPMFLGVLGAIEQAGLACGLPALILAGHTPPVDATVEFTTVTPDPAVIEINTAPSVDAEHFLQRSRAIYAAAAEQGLAPYRLYFNGAVADSGGGGQITLGGPSPEASPFLLRPQLLAGLVRFLNRHPALTYLYCHNFVGSGGQSVRADERGTDAFDELSLALDILQWQPDPSPELLWRSLAPFLCDASGNSHRAEINIEKLWNPYLAERGQQGLVEFRALRMQHSPQRATALACLLRAIVAMLAVQPGAAPLVDWGRELHERFALPFYLEQDLAAVMAELDAAGLGLAGAIKAVLLGDEFRFWGQVALPGCRLEVRRALEFWPLIGDAASPEHGGTSRLVDASTARVELRLRPADEEDAGWSDWQLVAAGVKLPMRQERDALGELQVFGLRYRSFFPALGLHPALGMQAPVRLLLRHPERATDQIVTLHEWHPEGEAYMGLPEDLVQARQRRAERVTAQTVARSTALTMRDAPARGLGPYCLDLRALFDPDPPSDAET